MRFRPLAIPLLLAAIIVPVAAAMALTGTGIGAGVGMAVGAAAATSLVVFAVRSKPDRRVEVAESTDAEHRVLVLAMIEPTAESAQRIADLAGSPFDVRVVVPVPSDRLDRWLSAEDDARAEAERRLAHAAGALVAAGLPVSGSVGDPDPAQALEDELRDFPADEIVLLAPPGKDPLARLAERLSLPLRRVTIERDAA